MKTTKITKADIESSVLSVPPLARRADDSIDREDNARVLAHLRSGGVKTFMYGGNANLYNIAPSEFVTLCELLMTTGLIYALPPAAIYYAVRRYMVSGLTAGAVKS